MLKSALIMAESLILALLLAVSKGDFSECQSLIQHGAYVDCRDENGNSPLMIAVSNAERLKLARMLVKADAALVVTSLGEKPFVAQKLVAYAWLSRGAGLAIIAG